MIAIDKEKQEKILLKKFTNLVQSYLDTKARERNYDSILSLCTYATSENLIFAKEGQAGVKWRDAVWAKCYEILNEIQSGIRTGIPTDIISELPTMEWGDTL